MPAQYVKPYVKPYVKTNKSDYIRMADGPEVS